jgi:putative PIN family toxin of toxin-antitoxin system
VKAVLDTNVIVSGIFFGGAPGQVLDAWAEGRFELILSRETFDEYCRTCEHLARSNPSLTFRAVLLRLIADGTLVADQEDEGAITRDRDDDKFMLCARDTGAVVVSGDRHLLEVSGWSGVVVLTPRDFLNLLK